MQIRLVSERDVPAVAALSGQLGYRTSEAEVAARILALDGSDEHAVFVAESEGDVVGWLHVTVVLSVETPRFAEIRGLVVHEPLRARGIGSLLVAAAEAWAAEHSCDRVRVRTNVKRAKTHDFYARRGFSPVKEQTVF